MMDGHGKWIDTTGDHKFTTICTFIDRPEQNSNSLPPGSMTDISPGITIG